MNQQVKENLLKSMMNASLDDKIFDPEDKKGEINTEDNEDQIDGMDRKGIQIKQFLYCNGYIKLKQSLR